MLSNVGSENRFWAEKISRAYYLINCGLPTKINYRTRAENGSLDKQVELTANQKAGLQQPEDSKELHAADESSDSIKSESKPYSIAQNRTRRIEVGSAQRYGMRIWQDSILRIW